MKASLRPTARLDVVKVGPRPFVASSDQAFWGRVGPHVGRLVRNKRHRRMKCPSDVFPGPNFDDLLIDFGIKSEPSEDAT